jgi:ubiquitin carboxyl-terminal hydrolase 7
LNVLFTSLHRYRGFESLEQLLRHTTQIVDVVYYEVLDLPLPALEQLKTLKVRGWAS